VAWICLSLLREFIYIFGSTAKSNALIISVFLVGLAAGSYAGTWRRFKASPSQARQRFWELQIINIIFLAIFFSTKTYFVYSCHHPKLVMAYFLTTVLVPSFIAGLSYAYIVQILHERGERLIIWVYGISTLGSVIGGLAHGLLLVPVWGIRSTYLASVACAGAAAFLMDDGKVRRRGALAAALVAVVIATIGLDPFRAFLASSKLVFSKDSEFGIVEVWRLDDAAARKNNARIGFGREPFPEGLQVIDMKINNVHQAYNLPVDRRIHEDWARTSLDIVGRKAKVLLLGYASGVTAEAYLRSPRLERIDIVENCGPIIEAGRKFFPEEYAKVMADPRARMIVDDFRGYARFTREKYDVIALDHSIQDPYQIGFFTTEFFGQLKKILNDGGVVLLLGEGLSWNTTRLSFPYIYKNIDPSVQEHIHRSCLYMTGSPFRPDVAKDYALMTDPPEQGGVVYSDDKVWRL